MRQGDVFIHGILSRSGTNYLARALGCHADLSPSPRSVWEFPHLRKSDPLLAYVESMAASPNLPRLEVSDLLPFLGEAWLAYASDGLPSGRRLLVKEPSVVRLERFFAFFPRACLLLLIRDGRDVACSSMRTRFAAPRGVAWRSPATYRRLLRSPVAELAERWRDASRTIRAFLDEGGANGRRVRVVRFEDLVTRPEEEIGRILTFLDLAPDGYDWQAFARLGVRGSSFVDNAGAGLDWSGNGPIPEGFDPIGRWRAWSERRIRAFRRVAGGELDHWGYGE